MLELTGLSPQWFRGRTILNAGSGKSHWGLDLTSKFGVIARKFENFDIRYTKRSPGRRLVGESLLAETGGDVNALPYKDGEFDLVWCSVAPPAEQEFWRVLKPGGRVYILPVLSQGLDTFNGRIDWLIKHGLPGDADIKLVPIPPEISGKYHIGDNMLVISKPNLVRRK